MRVCQIQRGWLRCFGAGLVALIDIFSSSKLWAGDLSKIETIVIIYAENRSFDHLYGLFPGANGLANANREQSVQRDHNGSELSYLTVWDSHGKPHPKFPRLPNKPFQIDAAPVGISADQVILSPIHAYYHNIEQINGGRNDMFAATGRRVRSLPLKMDGYSV